MPLTFQRLRKFLRSPVTYLREFSRYGLNYTAFAIVRAIQVLLFPFVILRISTMYSGRIGHLVGELEQILSSPSPSKKLGRATWDLFVVPSDSANAFVTKQYVELLRKRQRTVVLQGSPRRTWNIVKKAGWVTRTRVFSAGRSRMWFSGPTTDGGQFDSSKSLPETGHLVLSQGEIDEGWKLLRSVGFETSKPLVCIHVRDGAYLRSLGNKPNSTKHDYRDPGLLEYTRLALRLLDSGYAVVRTGSVAESRMPISHPDFFDYPFSIIQSDLMDVFLYRVCKFAISGGRSGLDALATVFRKPVLYSNSALVAPTYNRELGVFLFSRLVWQKNGSPLTLDESLAHVFHTSDQFANAGIGFLRNSSDEMFEAIKQLLQTPPDESNRADNMNRFETVFWKKYAARDSFKNLQPPFKFYPQIGHRFLERHSESLSL